MFGRRCSHRRDAPVTLQEHLTTLTQASNDKRRVVFDEGLMRMTGGGLLATWSLMMLQVSGTMLLYSFAKAWLPVRGAPKL